MKVIPFFDRYPLHTVKKNDFESFKRIVVMMNSELHLIGGRFQGNRQHRLFNECKWFEAKNRTGKRFSGL